MSDSFALQISVKLGSALFNVRGGTREEFNDNLIFASKNAAAIREFCAIFEPVKPVGGDAVFSPPSTATPAAAHPPDFSPPPPPPGAHKVRVVGIEEKSGISEGSGKPWTKWQISFDDGRKASTFDQLVAAVAKKVHAEGSFCVAFTKPSKNPKYTDLDGIQRAS